MKLHYLMAWIAIGWMAIAPAHAFDAEDYKAYAAEVRKTVWAQEGLPEFTNYKCPEKYKNESAVILAAYDEMLLDQKSRLKTFGLNFYTIKLLNYNRLHRQLIYINDQQSLKQFSEFDYATYTKEHYVGIGDDVTRNVLGVRIIKPDGTIREVSADDYVTANEGKKDRDKREKLAVPGLQVGDVIDVFTSEMRQIREENIDPVLITYVNQYPTLSYRIHCSIDPKLTTQYRTLNGAPDFTQSTDEEGNILLDAMVKNIDQCEPDLWYNTMAQTPLAMLYIQSKKIQNVYIPASVRDKGLQPNPSAAVIQKDDWVRYNTGLTFSYDKRYRKIISDAVARYTTDEERADYIYNFLTMDDHFDGYEQTRNPDLFIRVLASMMQKAKITFEPGITTSVYSEPLDQLISYKNTIWLLRLSNGKIYAPQVGPIAPGYIPSWLQGRQALFAPSVKKAGSGPYTSVTLPESLPADNVEHAQIAARIDGSLLHIDRTMSFTGTTKETPSNHLASSKQLCDIYAKAYEGIDTYEGIAEKKERALLPERIAKAEEKLKSNFADEVENYHGATPQQFGSGKMVALGNEKVGDAFVYETHYTMDGLVKRAGNNIVVAVGKLIGDQLSIEGNDRKRTADVYRTAPVTIERTIDITLPDGYEPSKESLAQLETQLENDCALFKTSTETTHGHLVLHMTKVYKHRTEPVANWSKMLQFVDTAYGFMSKQVVLRRK